MKQVSPNNYDASCESGTNYTGTDALCYSYTDGFSKPSVQTDAMGYKTQMAYDEYGNLAKKTLANRVVL